MGECLLRRVATAATGAAFLFSKKSAREIAERAEDGGDDEEGVEGGVHWKPRRRPP